MNRGKIFEKVNRKKKLQNMTLRDYFAGQALAGMLGDATRTQNLSNMKDESSARINAQWAYELADAMLKEKLNNQTYNQCIQKCSVCNGTGLVSQTYNQYIQKCPVCNGAGLISRPPGVAGDVETFVTTSTGPWPCKACNGTGIIR